MEGKMAEAVVLKTELAGIKLLKRGKVRDIYDLGRELLIVSTDRISAFDVVLPNGIPEKGKILTAMSVYWFKIKEDKERGSVCGIHLPAGLLEGSELKEPIFTPSTKAEAGHDENITFEEMKKVITPSIAEEVKIKSLAIYARAKEIASKKGIIIADTKLEFGIYNNSLVLIDEILTPDSSRFWPMIDYKPGAVKDISLD